MNKYTFSFLILSVLCFLFGCRQKDIRLATIKLSEGLGEAEEKTIVRAFEKGVADLEGQYHPMDGVFTDKIAFTNGVVYIHYDSMKIAKKNLEHFIMNLGYDANEFKGKKK